MKNPFARTGFDSLLGASCTMNNGMLLIAAKQTFVLDGNFIGTEVVKGGEDVIDGTTLIVGGTLKVNTVKIPNVTVTGKIECDLLVVEGTLAVKNGGEIKAREIQYRSLVIENGAIVSAHMNHLDHISAGEQT
jgi:cytoskeletal protein CcmA (bactofilin family)